MLKRQERRSYAAQRNQLTKRVTQIAILVCSKVAAIWLCKSAASLTRQDCKFTKSLKQVIASFVVTMRQACNKLAVSSSLQTFREKIASRQGYIPPPFFKALSADGSSFFITAEQRVGLPSYRGVILSPFCFIIA
ncbi:hypothetical protein AVEN_46420-1 [Araneus ventricosus]|uniref:Uncharacterized protein n=1 Tax=Araneus ventricosus TaxID=182803 RepID=A0A4Y2I5T4_ARAVE|nr:hypothetical protein AVEN_46420-1 [Araneus ventricosus]